MPRLSKALPKYSKHRASGQAVVTLSGRSFYLGPHGTKASKLEYDRLIAEWLANGRTLPTGPESQDQITVVEVIAGYTRHLRETYPNHAEKGSEPSRVYPVLRHLKAHYGRTPARDFGPLALKAIRQKFIDAGQSRKYVNENVRRIVRMFRWAVANEIVGPDTLRALQAVEGLRRGQCGTREGRIVKPVPLQDVEATLPHLPPVVADIVRLPLILGCRPGELLTMKPEHVERTEPDLWAYRPPHHKNSHRGLDRKIYLGPQAIAILAPYLLRPADRHCFSPQDSERQRNAARHAERRVPLHYGNRPGSRQTTKRKRPPRDYYSKDSYRRAVARAAEKAGVPPWFPYQLRHAGQRNCASNLASKGHKSFLAARTSKRAKSTPSEARRRPARLHAKRDN